MKTKVFVVLLGSGFIFAQPAVMHAKLFSSPSEDEDTITTSQKKNSIIEKLKKLFKSPSQDKSGKKNTKKESLKNKLIRRWKELTQPKKQRYTSNQKPQPQQPQQRRPGQKRTGTAQKTNKKNREKERKQSEQQQEHQEKEQQKEEETTPNYAMTLAQKEAKRREHAEKEAFVEEIQRKVDAEEYTKEAENAIKRHYTHLIKQVKGLGQFDFVARDPRDLKIQTLQEIHRLEKEMGEDLDRLKENPREVLERIRQYKKGIDSLKNRYKQKMSGLSIDRSKDSKIDIEEKRKKRKKIKSEFEEKLADYAKNPHEIMAEQREKEQKGLDNKTEQSEGTKQLEKIEQNEELIKKLAEKKKKESSKKQ